MARYGVIEKSSNCVVATYYHDRPKNLRKYAGSAYVQFEITEGTHQRAYSWNGSQVVFDPAYVPFDGTQKFCKIYRYIDAKHNKKVPPKGHNYVSGLNTRLFPKRFFVRGELQKVEWYANADLTDLVLQVDVVYTRDAAGFASERTTTRQWVLEDDTMHPDVKVTRKIYEHDYIQKVEEGHRRRGNIVKGLQLPVLGLLMATEPPLQGETPEETQARLILVGRAFLGAHKDAFTRFEQDSDRSISTDITNATDSWLDNVIDAHGTTVRAYILNELDIGGITG